MHDAARVRVREAARNVQAEFRRGDERQRRARAAARAVQPLKERAARRELVHERHAAVGVVRDAENVDDVGVPQRGERGNLAVKGARRARRAVARRALERLHRDGRAAPRRAPHEPKRALAERRARVKDEVRLGDGLERGRRRGRAGAAAGAGAAAQRGKRVAQHDVDVW